MSTSLNLCKVIEEYNDDNGELIKISKSITAIRQLIEIYEWNKGSTDDKEGEDCFVQIVCPLCSVDNRCRCCPAQAFIISSYDVPYSCIAKEERYHSVEACRDRIDELVILYNLYLVAGIMQGDLLCEV